MADLSAKRDAFLEQLHSMLSGPSAQDIKDEVGSWRYQACVLARPGRLGHAVVHCGSTAGWPPHCKLDASIRLGMPSLPSLLQAASALGDAFLVFSRSKAEGSPAAAACVDPSDDQVGRQID